MSSFIKYVRNYEKICKIGNEIINNKDFLRHSHPSLVNKEFQKQNKRIKEFVRLVNNSNDYWLNSPLNKNKYWKN
jgi:hypothetical protein